MTCSRGYSVSEENLSWRDMFHPLHIGNRRPFSAPSWSRVTRGTTNGEWRWGDAFVALRGNEEAGNFVALYSA